MLKVGDPAPRFKLSSTSGRDVSLADLKGRKVVLYFYPKDDTPGCTREACDFRDNLRPLKQTGAEVLGVSSDSLASHDRFRAKYSLPFELLSDADRRVATAYGAYGEKVLYGKKILGTIRSTFLIDEQGRVASIWSPVRVDGHVDKVIAAVRGEAAPLAPKKMAAPKKAGAYSTKAPSKKEKASSKKNAAKRPTRGKKKK